MADRVALKGAGTGPDEIIVRRSARARRYRIEVKRDGSVCLTIPVRGTERGAREFLARQAVWLERARARVSRLPRPVDTWTIGATILFRGEWTSIEMEGESAVSLGGRVFRVRSVEGDLRPVLEAHFRRIARVELAARAWELAAIHGAAIKRVSIRNQRTRWGSCSAAGTISLNWRLVQAPEPVADYVIVHELVHTRHMNHSAHFWHAMDAAFPAWREAERWLKTNGPALGV